MIINEQKIELLDTAGTIQPENVNAVILHVRPAGEIQVPTESLVTIPMSQLVLTEVEIFVTMDYTGTLRKNHESSDIRTVKHVMPFLHA